MCNTLTSQDHEDDHHFMTSNSRARTDKDRPGQERVAAAPGFLFSVCVIITRAQRSRISSEIGMVTISLCLFSPWLTHRSRQINGEWRLLSLRAHSLSKFRRLPVPAGITNVRQRSLAVAPEPETHSSKSKREQLSQFSIGIHSPPPLPPLISKVNRIRDKFGYATKLCSSVIFSKCGNL